MESAIVTIKKAVVIYHDNCMDGFASAWAFHCLKEKDYEQTEYYPYSYGQVFHPTDNQSDIYIVDFSFPRDIITYIAENSKTVTILDHHKTAQEQLENWTDKPANVTIVFDMSRSGAGITWDYFAEQSILREHAEGKTIISKEYNTRPALIAYVEDRDLWKFSLPDSKQINALIAVADKTFEDYTKTDAYIGYQTAEASYTGSLLMKQHQQICESIVKDARPITIFTEQGEFHGLASNCTGQFASEVGNLLQVQSGTFGATYFSDKSGVVRWSLRSSGSYDVSSIAKAFGGGGHRNAAGFAVHLNLELEVDPTVIHLSQITQKS